MENNRILKQSDIKKLIEENIKYIKEDSDLEQEMALWKERSNDSIGKILGSIDKAFREVIASEKDEFGISQTAISPYIQAYIIDGVGPEKWIKGLMQTLENYDMIVCNGNKCKGVDGDLQMSRLVNKLISYASVQKDDQMTTTESFNRKIQEAFNDSRERQEKRREVMNQIDKIISSGKMFGFDMSDYVDKDGFPAGYMAIGYDQDKDELYVGSTTNSGIMREVTVPYEYEATLDGNLENLYEALIEELLKQGYSYGEDFNESVNHNVNEAYGEESTPEQVVAAINKVRSTGKMFGFNMDDYVNDEGDTAGYMGIVYDPQENLLYCGSVTNSGVFREAEIEYDHSFDLDGNLEALMEVLSQNLMDQGYYPRD